MNDTQFESAKDKIYRLAHNVTDNNADLLGLMSHMRKLESSLPDDNRAKILALLEVILDMLETGRWGKL